MILATFIVDGVKKSIYYDCEGWILREALEMIPKWVVEEWPTATDIQIPSMLMPVGHPTRN